MQTLIERIRERLQLNAYANEAAISHGVVTPVLNALGWDIADPAQMVPEYPIDRGRVDFALFGLGHRPAVFIEVKQVGRAVEGDRQLFTYAFRAGVPLCVLTDGREWSFYLPGAQGSYEDRRVYRLQLDDRDPQECERVLTRYLSRERVRDNRAFEDAQRDYRDAAGKREATAKIPGAWSELLAEPHELLLEIVGDKAEALCGYRPAADDVLAYLRRLTTGTRAVPPAGLPIMPPPPKAELTATPAATGRGEPSPKPDRSVVFRLHGKEHRCATGAEALVELLSILAARDPDKVAILADAVRTPKRNQIAHSPAEVNPGRPDLARAAEFAPGWVVGLNTSSRDKMGMIRVAAQVFGLSMPDELEIALPNS